MFMFAKTSLQLFINLQLSLATGEIDVTLDEDAK